MIKKPKSFPTKRLAVSISATATSAQLNNLTDWFSCTADYTSWNSSTGYPVVFRNASNTKVEFMQMDTTQTTGTTIELTRRGLSDLGGITTGEGSTYAWNKQETLVDLGANAPLLYEAYADKYSTETITGVWNVTTTGQWAFNYLPTINAVPSASSDVANKGYVDSTVSSSLAYNAQVITDSLGVDVSQGNVLYFSSSDQLWYKADADLTTSFQNKTLGMALTSGANTSSINIMLSGRSSSISTSMTAGTKYFLGNAAGSIDTTGTYEVYLGYAISSTEFLLEQRRDDMPFAYEKDALAGLAFTTSDPSATNMYLTKFDTTSAVTTSQLVVLRNSTGDIIVNATPQSSSAAASKSYVDTQVATKDLSYIANVIPSSGDTSITHVFTLSTSNYNTTPTSMGQDMFGVWECNTTSNPRAIGGDIGGITTGVASTSNDTTFSNMKRTRVKASAAFYPHSSNMPTSSGSNSAAIGFTFTATSLALWNSTGGSGRANFYYEYWSSSLHAITFSTGTGVTDTTIASFSFYNSISRNVYEIELLPSSSAKFYLNGILVATHITNLPASTSTLRWYAMHHDSSGANVYGMRVSHPTISYEL